MPQPLETTLQSLLGESYKIQRELPGGGMSRVFVAFEPALKREVVVKVLPPDLRSSRSLTRFAREIEVTARLQHPHILPVLTTGGSEHLLYYVVPYVAGGSVRDHLQTRRRMPFEQAVRAASELLVAVGFAHERGVVHRDIKPGNVLLSEGHALLMDFGIATFLAAEHDIDHGTSTSVASPAAYRAPERPQGEAADLYAVAVLTFELLTGRLPENTSSSAVSAAILDAHPDVRGERVRAVARVLARALAKDPSQRFPTAGAFHDALVDPSARRRSRLIFGLPAAAALVLAVVTILRDPASRIPAALDGPRAELDTSSAASVERSATRELPQDDGVRRSVAPELVQLAARGPASTTPQPDSARILLGEALRLAWSDAPGMREDATRAAVRALSTERLRAAEALVARGVASLGRHQYPSACAAFDSALTIAESYDAWMGAAECRFRDTTVVLDDEVRGEGGRARFRGSYYRAARAYIEAARLAPPAATLPYRRLADVAFTEPARIRRGWTPDGRLYLGQPVAVADSFTFEAFPPGPRRVTPAFVAANLGAVALARTMLRPALSAWARHAPGNVHARLQLIELLEAVGNIREPGRDGLTALGEVAAARRVTPTDDAAALRLAHAHVRLLLRARRFEDAAALADSVLAANPSPGAREAELLLTLAILTGKASRAETLLQLVSGSSARQIRTAEGRPVAIPPVMIRERAAFVVSAALGICNEHVRAAPGRLSSAIRTLFPAGAPRGVESAFLERPLLLAIPCVGADVARTVLAEPGHPLMLGLIAPTDAARAGWKSRLATINANRAAGVMYESTETSLPEAWLHLADGDTTTALATLRRVLDALPALPPAFLNHELQAGTLARAMAAAAELARAAGDDAEARRWSAAVLALWERADPPLQSKVERMRAVHGALGEGS